MLNNFLRPESPHPPAGRQWNILPRVKIFTNTDPAILEVQINAFIDVLALPVTPQIQYNIVDVRYTGAQLANNETEYGALIHYQQWTPT